MFVKENPDRKKKKNLTRKTTFFEGSLWIKVNYLGLTLDMALKSYASVAKGLKLKTQSSTIHIQHNMKTQKCEFKFAVT